MRGCRGVVRVVVEVVGGVVRVVGEVVGRVVRDSTMCSEGK